jgi:hypothetical protein
MKKIIKKYLLTILAVSLISACQQKSKYDEMVDFGNRYTEAWNSKIPANMASFYALDGTLVINNGTPSVGRDQLAETAKSFMTAFPDLKLTMDSLTQDAENFRYYWTFEGTNTGPDGTGNEVVFSGFEEWTMNSDMLIQTSIGTFDSEDYNEQLNALNLLTSDIYNRTLAYEFEDYVTIDLTFSSDTTLYWKVRNSEVDANENIKTIHLNEFTTLTGWVEDDETVVSLYSDFKIGQTYGYQYFKNGRIKELNGSINKVSD